MPPGKGPFEMLARFANPTKRLGQHGQESALFGDLWQKKQVIGEKDVFLDLKSNQQERTPIGPRLGLGLIKELSEPSSKKPLYGFDLRNVHNFFGVSEKDSLEAGENIRNFTSPDSGLGGLHRGIKRGRELVNETQGSKTPVIYKSPSQNSKNRTTRSDKNIARDILLLGVEDAMKPHG